MPRNQQEAPVRLIDDENSAHLFPKRLEVPSSSIFEDCYCICGITESWKKIIVMALDSLTRHDSFNNIEGVYEIERLIAEINCEDN